jgi:hypothetical protein
VATLTDPAQRAYAEGYLEALSYQRAGVQSYQRAEAAFAAKDMLWYGIQRDRAQRFHAREQEVVRGTIDAGDPFISTLAPLNTAQIETLKSQLATSGFDPQVQSILSALGMSAQDQAVLSHQMSQIATEDWPTPPFASLAALRYSEAVDTISQSLSTRTPNIYLPSMKR